MSPSRQQPVVGPGAELQLTIDGGAVPHLEVLSDSERLARAPAREELVDADLLPAPSAPRAMPAGTGEENFYAVAERLAARAATASTRKQYGSIGRTFGDWLRDGLSRPPLLGDVDADVLAAYARHLEQHGGRGGGPAAPATRRVYLSVLRAMVREAGLPNVAADVRVPRHTAAPPETLTETEVENMIRVPDRRSTIGKRDYALLRVLADCGLRSAELRGLVAGDVRRPRANAAHLRLLIRGKGGREREIEIPELTQVALDTWTAVHPLALGGRLARTDPLFVRLGRYRGAQPPAPLSAQAIHKLVRAVGVKAGAHEPLCHPHALRSYWATSQLEDGVPIHVVQDGLGHAELGTTGRYTAVRPEQRERAVETIDRRHQAGVRRVRAT